MSKLTLLPLRYTVSGALVRWRGLFLLLLLLQAGAWPQSSAALRYALEFAAAVTASIVANYATKHLDTYTSNWGPSGTPEGNYAEGLKRWRAGNREEAMPYLLRSARSGYSRAQLFLGDAELHDLKYAEARDWYLRADSHEEAWAGFQLGNMASSGVLGGVDYAGALNWYRRAARRRMSDADLMVFDILMNGKLHPGAPEPAEAKEAADALEDAAIQGNGRAQANLGYMYFAGIGRPPGQFCQGLKWTKLAAEKGVAAAIGNLGSSSENGDCTVLDRVLALQYYRRGASLGDGRSAQSSARLESQLKVELATLSSTPQSVRQGPCSLLPWSKVYDSNLNETQLWNPSGQVVVYARDRDFVMIQPPGPVPEFNVARFVQPSQIVCF